MLKTEFNRKTLSAKSLTILAVISLFRLRLAFICITHGSLNFKAIYLLINCMVNRKILRSCKLRFSLISRLFGHSLNVFWNQRRLDVVQVDKDTRRIWLLNLCKWVFILAFFEFVENAGNAAALDWFDVLFERVNFAFLHSENFDIRFVHVYSVSWVNWELGSVLMDANELRYIVIKFLTNWATRTIFRSEWFWAGNFLNHRLWFFEGFVNAFDNNLHSTFLRCWPKRLALLFKYFICINKFAHWSFRWQIMHLLYFVIVVIRPHWLCRHQALIKQWRFGYEISRSWFLFNFSYFGFGWD